MKKLTHPRNEAKQDQELVDAALDELVAMEKRQNEHRTVLDRRIPAQDTDSDILIGDALRRAGNVIEQRDELLRGLKAAGSALQDALVLVGNHVSASKAAEIEACVNGYYGTPNIKEIVTRIEGGAK